MESKTGALKFLRRFGHFHPFTRLWRSASLLRPGVVCPVFQIILRPDTFLTKLFSQFECARFVFVVKLHKGDLINACRLLCTGRVELRWSPSFSLLLLSFWHWLVLNVCFRVSLCVRES